MGRARSSASTRGPTRRQHPPTFLCAPPRRHHRPGCCGCDRCAYLLPLAQCNRACPHECRAQQPGLDVPLGFKPAVRRPSGAVRRLDSRCNRRGRPGLTGHVAAASRGGPPRGAPIAGGRNHVDDRCLRRHLYARTAPSWRVLGPSSVPFGHRSAMQLRLQNPGPRRVANVAAAPLA